MAAAVYRWWQMIHNGGQPTVISLPSAASITDPVGGAAITDPVGGAEITDPGAGRGRGRGRIPRCVTTSALRITPQNDNNRE